MSNKKLCRVCLSTMYEDDRDLDYRGNGDIYWCCENEKCNSSCIEVLRNRKLVKEIWHWERGDNCYDYEENYNVS